MNGSGEGAAESTHGLKVDVAEMGAASEENAGGLVERRRKSGR